MTHVRLLALEAKQYLYRQITSQIIPRKQSESHVQVMTVYLLNFCKMQKSIVLFFLASHSCDELIFAGGWVEYNRVNGNLALSRALGDFVFKVSGSVRSPKLPSLTVRRFSGNVLAQGYDVRR